MSTHTLSKLYKQSYSDAVKEYKNKNNMKEKDKLPYPNEHYWLELILVELEKIKVGHDLAVYVARFLVELKNKNFEMNDDAINNLILATHLEGAYTVQTKYSHLWTESKPKNLSLDEKYFIST